MAICFVEGFPTNLFFPASQIFIFKNFTTAQVKK